MENPEKLEVITFRDCNLTQFDFSALSLFSNLEYIRVEGGSLIEFTKMPSLSNLKIVHVNSPQFRRWYNPRLTPKIHSITLHNITNDVTTDEIIDSLLFYKNTLRELAISYSNLTRIPPKVKQFTNLYTFEFQRNPLMSALRAGSFPPTFKPKLLLLSFNNITLIEADTFQGNFSGTNIDLTGSHLPSLEEALFEPILRSMNSGQSGEIELGRLEVCDCNLAWLHRDNRHLLNHIMLGRCKQVFSERTAHDLRWLSPTLFQQCPSNSPFVITSQ